MAERSPEVSLAILHFVGRDSTMKYSRFHNKIPEKIEKIVIGHVKCGEEGWEPLVPPTFNGVG
jgi:hypothetical protein